MHQPGPRAGAALAVGVLLDSQIAELEHQLFEWRGAGLWHGFGVGGQLEPQRHQDRVQRGIYTPRAAAQGDVGWLSVKKFFQHAEPGVVQRQGDHRKAVWAALALQAQRVLELFAYPPRLQSVRADQHRQRVGLINGLTDHLPQQIAAANLARVDPDLLAAFRQRLAQLAHQGVVLGRVRDEQLA